MNKRLKTIIFLTISIFIFIQSCAYVTTPLISKKDKKADAAVAEEYYTKSLDAEKNGDIYKLYDDFDDAKAGIEVTLIFDTATGLSEGSTKIIT